MIELQTAAQSSIFAELNGRILAEKNAQKILPIFGLSRLILVYETLSAIRSKKILPSTPIIVSKELSYFSKKDQSAQIHFRIGEIFTIKQAIEMLLIISEKSAAYLLVEKIFGSLDNWKIETARFLKQAKIEGVIYDPVGFENAGQENLLSARSVLKIINKLVNDFPKILTTIQRKRFIFQSDQQAQFYKNPNFQQQRDDLQISAFVSEKNKQTSSFISIFKIKDKLYLSELLAVDNTFFNREETADTLINNLFLEVEKQLWQE